MNDLVDILVRYGYVVVFGWVFAEQIGLPIPAMPVLLAAGAMAGTGPCLGWDRLARERRHLVLDRPPWRRPRPGLLVPDRARARLVRAALRGDLQPTRRALAPDRQVRAGLQHRGAAACGHRADALRALRGLHRHRRPHLGRSLCRSRLAVQPSAGTGGELRHAPGRLARRDAGGGFRRLHRVEVPRAATVSAADPDRANHAGRAEG